MDVAEVVAVEGVEIEVGGGVGLGGSLNELEDLVIDRFLGFFCVLEMCY